ncbi:MAG: hypothetical protein ACOX89_05660, partial [Lutispora sp.]
FSGNKVERKFYSNNLMTLEYIDDVQPTIDAIKKLNLDKLAEEAKEDVEIIIIPGISGNVEKHDNILLVDFFKVKNTENGLTISGENLEDVLKTNLK